MKRVMLILLIIIIICASGISIFLNKDELFSNKQEGSNAVQNNIENNVVIDNQIAEEINTEEQSKTTNGTITSSNNFRNDFEIDVTLNINNRNIHHSRYIPENIDELEEISLYITLPGWEGLYFQGVGSNLVEDFYWVAKDMNPNMIILAPQLDDWGEQSAEDTILLTEYYKETYNVENIYINGLSGGGETLSLVLDKRPDLYKKALLVSSKWDGGYDNVVNAKVPVYFFIGENDSYYGSDNFKETYNILYSNYEEQGLSSEEIDELLILDVKNHEYFTSHGFSDEHAGCGLAAHEEDIMKWLLEID